MRKSPKMYFMMVISLIGMALLLSACGEKTSEDVLNDLNKQVSNMDGYQAKAEMEMHVGDDEQTFHVEIGHKKKGFYKVKLTHGDSDEDSQVILKNKEGVFIITPTLKKKFKFKADWPGDGSQPYLYKSLIKDIEKDSGASFEETEDAFIYKAKTNYKHNKNFPYQKISFDKKTYAPKTVEILDKNMKTVVKVNFTSFEFDPGLEESDFDVKKDPQPKGEDVLAEKEELEVLYPTYTSGSELDDKKVVDLEDGERVIMTYDGESKFSIIEEKKQSLAVSTLPQEIDGEVVHLGYSLGFLTDNAIEWNHNGTHFYLASEDLPAQELVKVAKSVNGKQTK